MGRLQTKDDAIRVMRPVLRAVSEFYVTTPSRLLAHDRHPVIVRPRHVVMWLAYRRYHVGLSGIARALGRHHTSVWAAIRSLERQLPEDELLRAELAEVEDRLERHVSHEEGTFEQVLRPVAQVVVG